MKKLLFLVCAIAAFGQGSASAATLTVHNVGPSEAVLEVVLYENADWTVGAEYGDQFLYFSVPVGDSGSVTLPAWYLSAELLENTDGASVRFVEGDESVVFWWTGSVFLTSEPVVEPELPPGVLSLETQIKLFFAGAGFIAPLLVVPLVIKFSRKGALSDVS